MYSSRNTNPFYENEEDDEKRRSSVRAHEPDTFDRPMDRRQQLLYQIDQSEDRQLASTQRALSSIYDSERMGIATAEELIHQGEQLDNVERKTDEIDKNLTISQKHLNSIKSVFGGIKTWWTGGGKKPEDQPKSSRDNALRTTVENDRKNDPQPPGVHPILRLKGEDGRGIYEDDLDGRFMAGARNQPSRNYDSNESALHFKTVTKSEKEKKMEQNLSLMSDGMTKLKDLAQNLGNEIETQNAQLDRINTKVQKTDITLGDKNSQMKKILYK